MSVKVTLEFATIDEAITQLAKLRAGEKEAKAETTKADAAKATKDATTGKSDGATDKKTSTASAADSKPSASDKKADAPQTQASESSTQVGYGIVADKIATGAKTHRAEVVALLAKYGAKSGKELKAEQYAEFVVEIDKITAPPEDLA